MSNLALPWRVGFFLGLCAILADVFWTLEYRVAGNFADAPSWVSAVLGTLSLAGWIAVVVSAWKWWRARRDGPVPNEALFRPRSASLLELIAWIYLPIVLFSGFVVARQLDLNALLAGLLLAILLIGWPMFLALSRMRYEVTDGAFVIRSPVSRQSIAWADLTGVRALQKPLFEQLRFEQRSGRPLILISPVEREVFLAQVAARAPAARMDV